MSETSAKKKSIYFPNLHGLRFIAAALVIIHHIEQFKSVFGLDSYWGQSAGIEIIGKLGVILFFVLSGFLITYLLLCEEEAHQDIRVKQFYMRRVLRIWPLYFLIVILAFFVLPFIGLFEIPGFDLSVIHQNLGWKLLLYALFLPNLVLPLFGVVPFVSHTWSIGTEEQFYLIWPLILKFVKKHRLFLMLGIIFFYLLVEKFFISNSSDFITHKQIMRSYWASFNIDCMAIGGVFAILLFQKSKWLQVLYQPVLFYLVLIALPIMLWQGVVFPLFHNEIYAVLFGLLILNLASNSRIRVSLENRVFNYLGNISYGLYMFHSIGIVSAIALCQMMGIKSNLLIYPLSFLSTTLIASLSYHYFENYFLKFKARFSTVISGHKKED